MRYAIIENGTVVNVVLADAAFAASQGWIEAGEAGPGWTYADGVFSPPEPLPEPVPATTSRTQLRLALLEEPGEPGAGDDTLLDWVDRVVAASTDRALKERWAAGTMERASPLLATMAAVFGLTDPDVDRIFRKAATL